MKKVSFLFSLAIGATMLVACGGNVETAEVVETPVVETATYIVDPATSSVVWKGNMVGIKVHEGTVGIASGSLSTENGVITGGEFVIDMTNIIPTDNNYDEADYSREKLVAHLTSEDFFAVEANPTAAFKVTGMTEGVLNGELTVRGVTAPAAVTVTEVVEADATITASGTLTFNRKDFGVNFDMPMADMVISNDVEMAIAINGMKEAEMTEAASEVIETEVTETEVTEVTEEAAH